MPQSMYTLVLLSPQVWPMWGSGLEIIFSNLPVKMTSTSEFVSVVKQNVCIILSQKQEFAN